MFLENSLEQMVTCADSYYIRYRDHCTIKVLLEIWYSSKLSLVVLHFEFRYCTVTLIPSLNYFIMKDSNKKYQVCISSKQTMTYNLFPAKDVGLTENFAITNLPSSCRLHNFVYHCLNLKKCMIYIRYAAKSNILFVIKSGMKFYSNY